MAASIGGFSQMLIGYALYKKFKATDCMNGILSGLASITPGSGFVNTHAMIIPLIASSSSFFLSR